MRNSVLPSVQRTPLEAVTRELEQLSCDYAKLTAEFARSSVRVGQLTKIMRNRGIVIPPYLPSPYR